MQDGDNNGKHMLSNLKSDMEQTCWRFECLEKGQKIESFRSAFDGNSRKYMFNRDTLFEEKGYVPYNNTDTERKNNLSQIEKIGQTTPDRLPIKKIAFDDNGKKILSATDESMKYWEINEQGLNLIDMFETGWNKLQSFKYIEGKAVCCWEVMEIKFRIIF